jgi:molybdate transport system permease protein
MADGAQGVMSRFTRTPLPWLAGLLVAYLLVPLGFYLSRLSGGTGHAGPGLGAALAVSLETAAISTAIIALLGVPLGYLLARGRGRTSSVLGVVVQLPLALPPLMSGILLIYVVGPYSAIGSFFGGALTGTRAGIVLAQTFVAAPFCVVAARSAFAALDPSYDDVAATLGHGRWARFARVALPAAAPGIGAGLLLSFLRAFGEFGATVILAYHPYSLPVYTYVQFTGSGLPSTLAPVGAGLGAAVAVLALVSLVPRLRRPRSTIVLPPARVPAAAASPLLSVDLDARLGDFRLHLAHRAAGRHLAILGPSGAGKTTALRVLAGLTAGGTVRLDGHDVSAVPPERRGIGYVPQETCLLPRLPVWRQACFGVGTDPALASYWLERLRIAELADRQPGQLSGGQRRRVTLARALARAPRLLLLDEPLTGLDTPVRHQLRRELRRLQRETGLSTVLVTHDPTEAALLADEVLVLDDGALLQAGSLPELVARPASPAVARLVGWQNVFTGLALGGGRVGSGSLRLDAAGLAMPAGASVTWAVAAERLALSPYDGHPGTVVDVVDFGHHHEAVVDLNGGIDIAVRTADPPAIGSRCGVVVPANAVIVWPGADRATAAGTTDEVGNGAGAGDRQPV